MVEVFSRKGALKAAEAHPESHRIHIYESFLRLALIELFLISIDVSVNGDIVFDSPTSSQSDVFSESFEPRMIRYVVVVYVDTLSNFVSKFLFSFGVTNPHERDYRDS